MSVESRRGYRLIVTVLKDWRVTIPYEVRAKARLEIGDLLLANWEDDRVTFRKVVPTIGGTLI